MTSKVITSAQAGHCRQMQEAFFPAQNGGCAASLLSSPCCPRYYESSLLTFSQTSWPWWQQCYEDL